MKSEYIINKNKMRNIRIEVVKFHLEVNKKILNFLKVTILIAALLQIPLGFIFGFKIGYYVLIIVAVLVNVLFSKSVQLHLAVKNIEKHFASYQSINFRSTLKRMRYVLPSSQI